jgi:hypothetical protein
MRRLKWIAPGLAAAALLGAAVASSAPRPTRHATPSAKEFGRILIGTANAYGAAHGDPARLEQADCVQASPGYYMCSYAVTRPDRPRECHLMQAEWTPGRTSSFKVTLAGRVSRCSSLRTAIQSLR